MGELSVRIVRGAAGRRRYLSLVRKPYEDSPNWVHPDTRVLAELLRGKTLLGARSEWRALVAEDDGQPVACLTVFVHKSFEEKFAKKIATIGFFEALPGHGAAVRRLFSEAEDWARSRGATRVWGPMNGHIMYGFGCLENRYDEPPVVGTAYNRPEYPGHWWNADYRHAPSFYSYRVDLTAPATRARVDRALAIDLGPLRVRSADLGQWRREVEIFVELHNVAFERNWGDTPLSHDEMWELMGLARYTLDPEMFVIAEEDGRPVAMALGMPDLNQAFGRVSAPPASVRGGIAFLLFRRTIRRGGLMAIAVRPEFRRRGLAEHLTARVMKRMIDRGFVEMEYCLVLEDNFASQRLATRFGGEHTKTYRMFEKRL